MLDFFHRSQSCLPSRTGRGIRSKFLIWGSCLCLLAQGVAYVVAQQPAPDPTPAASTTPAPMPPEPMPPDPKPPAAGTPDSIEQSQPKFFVVAEADRASREYYDGEQIGIKVKCEIDAYLYVLYTQADGQSYVVFPNSATPNNQVKAKQSVQLPSANDTFRWTVGAPFGKEELKVVASRVKIPAFEKPEVRRQ